jgi:hypothetical protein
MKAEALSHKPGYVGAVAFSRAGTATGDFGDARPIRKSATYRTISARCEGSEFLTSVGTHALHERF